MAIIVATCRVSKYAVVGGEQYFVCVPKIYSVWL